MYVKVRAKPDSNKEQVIEADEREFIIHIKEPAKQNLANTRIIQILAEQFSVPVRSVHQLSGFRSPTKVFSIDP